MSERQTYTRTLYCPICGQRVEVETDCDYPEVRRSPAADRTSGRKTLSTPVRASKSWSRSASRFAADAIGTR